MDLLFDGPTVSDGSSLDEISTDCQQYYSVMHGVEARIEAQC